MRVGGKIVALCGGVGGAKLAVGLAQTVAPQALSVIVNTGDDFEHLGLSISPDLDTVMYSLAGLADPERGWGRRDESWRFMAALRELGGPDWFQLGDLDLATHVERSRRLAGGETLSAITADLSRRLGIGASIIPMADTPVRTMLHTATEGVLTFQDYFVRRRTEPEVRRIEIVGAATTISPEAATALDDPALALIVICPSNPWLSILPLLELRGMRERLARRRCPVVAVTPIIAGAAVKGPTAQLMAQLGLHVSATSVADFYSGLIDGFLLDERDTAQRGAIEGKGLRVATAETLMTDLPSKRRLAEAVLAFGDLLSSSR